MKRVLIQVLAAIALIVVLIAPDRIAPPPEAEFHVQDETGLFSHSAKTEITTSAYALANLTGAQIVVTSGTAARPDTGVLIQVDVAEKTAWVDASPEFLAALGPERHGGESYLGLNRLGYPRREALLLYRDILKRVMKQYGLTSLPRYGLLEKYVMLSRDWLVLAVAVTAAVLIFAGWLKRRLCPPQYPLEKEGPFLPAHAPDMLTHKPR